MSLPSPSEPAEPAPRSPFNAWRLGALALLLVSVAAVVGLSFYYPGEFTDQEEVLTVSELMADPDSYLGTRVTVKGKVVVTGLDVENRTFLFSDDLMGENAPVLEVTYQELPENLRRGKEALVVGTLAPGPVLEASEVIIGHSTDY